MILSKFIIQVFSFAYLPEFKTPENEDKVSGTEFFGFLRWLRLIQIHCNFDVVLAKYNRQQPLV
jgi:hypothetical protein